MRSLSYAVLKNDPNARKLMVYFSLALIGHGCC